jgi:hypothetical protein
MIFLREPQYDHERIPKARLGSRHLFELPEARGPLSQKPEIQKSECQHDEDVPLALTDCWKVGDHMGSMWIDGSLRNFL